METLLEIEEKVTPMPRIGDIEPRFKAVTTQGDINFPEDHVGSLAIHFSHPAEFMTFAKLENKFAKANCKLAGFSIDGLYSYIAWLRTIKDKIVFRDMKNIEVKFPLVEDITMEIAKKYGMLQPGERKTQVVRAVFFVNPKGIIRAIIYYPLSLGRNFDEIYRALIAMQTADVFSVATPADWEPGDDVIVPPAGSCSAANERVESTNGKMGCTDWFFCTRKLEKEHVFDKVLKK